MVNVSQKPTNDIGFTHEDFAALLDKYDYHFSPGDIVPGTVFSLEPRGALIDIGAKTAAYIPIQEMSINRVDNPDEVLQSNETREFYILSDENEEGQLTLSIRRIEYMRAWERVRQLQTEDATVRSGVFATNRGGALVRIEGLRGFIPGSHISTRKPKEDLVGEELPLKFLEVDEERNRLVLSHRRALVERKMNRLEVGEVVIGTVRGIKPYGAFIDIGGVSGLLHISEISHEHIDTPHSVFNVNDELKVMIIDLDAERGRISLSTKQLEPEPGDMIKNRDVVFDKAEEMAAKFREQLLAKEQGIVPETAVESASVEEVPPATEEAQAEQAPAETEAQQEVPAETEAQQEAPAEAEAQQEAPAETEAQQEVPAETEAQQEVPAETEAQQEAPAETEAQQEVPAEAEAQQEVPAEAEVQQEVQAETEVQQEVQAETEVQNETQEQVAEVEQ